MRQKIEFTAEEIEKLSKEAASLRSENDPSNQRWLAEVEAKIEDYEKSMELEREELEKLSAKLSKKYNGIEQ